MAAGLHVELWCPRGPDITWEVQSLRGSESLSGVYEYDYLGPLQPARGQTPFMPLPRLGPSALGSGPHAIRGALFAEQELIVT